MKCSRLTSPRSANGVLCLYVSIARTMRWSNRAMLLIAFAYACGGCFPATFVQVPAFHGRVVDRDLHPIAGATLQLTDREKTIATITTAADGTFSRREQGRLFIYIVPEDLFLERFDSTLTARSAYGSTSTPVSVHAGMRVFCLLGKPTLSGIDLKDIQLP